MKKTHKIVAGILVAIIAIASILVWKHSHKRLTCTKDFATWEEAYDAYKSGKGYLDGDGDLIPCENLLPFHGRK